MQRYFVYWSRQVCVLNLNQTKSSDLGCLPQVCGLKIGSLCGKKRLHLHKRQKLQKCCKAKKVHDKMFFLPVSVSVGFCLLKNMMLFFLKKCKCGVCMQQK